MNLKSKAFWLNIIAITLAVIGYFADKGMFPNWAPWFGLLVVVLNMVSGMIQSNTVTKLRKENTQYKNRMNQPK